MEKKYPVARSLFGDFERMLGEPLFWGFERFPDFGKMAHAHGEITETEKDVILNVEIPGVKKDDINLEITRDYISVGVESKKEEEKRGKGEYEYRSRYEGFGSSYRMPAQVNADEAKASYKNGILEVRIPKAGVPKGKKVKVE